MMILAAFASDMITSFETRARVALADAGISAYQTVTSASVPPHGRLRGAVFFRNFQPKLDASRMLARASSCVFP